MADFNIQKQQLISQLKQTHPELALYPDDQILTIYNEQLSGLHLSEDEQISILSGLQSNGFGGLNVETQVLELTGAQEEELRKALSNRIESVTAKTAEAESKNGFLGKGWNWMKNNLLDFCTDSTNDIKKAQEEERAALKGDIKEAFRKITGLDYTRENLTKFLNSELPTKSEQALIGYTEGQEMAADFAGDMISGIAAVGIYTAAVAAAPFTGGASIALGLGLATISGGLIKSGVKSLDAYSADRDYDSFTKDMITGGFSGVLAPITGGVGGAVGRGVASKLGVQAIKHVGQEAVEATGKQTLKTILTNPVGYEYVGKRWGVALASEMAVDGALGGSIDTTFRTAYDLNEKGEEITADALLSSFLQGGLGGLVMAPAIGGGMKMSGKFAGKMLGHFSDANVPNIVREIEAEEVWMPRKKELPKTEGNIIKSIPVTAEKIEEAFSRINNPYLKENKEEALELVTRMLSMTKNGYNGTVERFTTRSCAEILQSYSPQNKEIFELLLNVRGKKDYLVASYNIPEFLEAFSKVEPGFAKKLFNMCICKDEYFVVPSDVTTIISLAEKYPKELSLLSCDYNPAIGNKRCFANLDALESLLEQIKTSTPEKQEMLSFLTANKDIDNNTLQFVLDADIAVNKNQVQTLCQVYYYNSLSIAKELDKLSEVKGKKLSFDAGSQYTKAKRPSFEDNMAFVKEAGLSEEDALSFCISGYADSLIQFIKFSESTGNQMFNGASRKEVLEQYNLVVASGNKELLKELDDLEPLIPYLNKENYELFKNLNNNVDLEDFIKDLEWKTTNVECQNTCAIINKQTGREIYEQDLIVLGSSALRLSKLSDSDVAESIKVLNELGLYKEDANLLTLLTRAKELKDLNVTPVVKEFLGFLLQNKNLEEGILLDILLSVKGKTNEITASKINFVKDIMSDGQVSQREIARVMDRLSFDNLQILNKQLDVMSEVIENDSRELNLVSKLLDVNEPEEFNIYYNLYQSLKDNSSRSKFTPIYSIMSTNNIKIKKELAVLLIKVLEKNNDITFVNELSTVITNNTYDVSKRFIDFYLKNIDADLGAIKDFYNEIVLLHVGDVNSMNLKHRVNLYGKLSDLDENGKAVLKNLGLDFDNLYDKVVTSLGAKRPLVTLSSKQELEFVRQILANNNPQAEKVLREFDFAKFGKNGLPLKYTRESFNKKIEELLKDVPDDEVLIILKHFGLERGEVGFEGIPNNRVFDKTDISAQTTEAAAKIQIEIENFTVRNEVLMPNPEIKEVLDGLVKGLPEFTSIVGKKQHGTHAYSVDIHTLKVLQSAMNNPLYDTLSDLDKVVLKYSIILHDFGKKGGVIDQGHASLSADYAWSILDRYQLPQYVKDRVIDIVENHHWFEKYNTGACSAENVAVRCRNPEDLKIYEIFSKADFENVNETFHLGNKSGGSRTQAEFDAYMKTKMEAIEEAVGRIYQKANLVFDTQFMHNGRKFPTKQVEIDGVTQDLKVLSFSDLADGEDLAKYGFAPNITKENARFFVHMTEPERTTLETVFRLTETPVFQSTWSTSLIKESNNRTYGDKEFGFVFDTPQANISEAFFRNSGSGTAKTIDAFQNFLFGARTCKVGDTTYDVRHFVKNNFIKEMQDLGYDLNETEYAALSQYLFKKKYTSQITKDIEVGTTIIRAKDLVTALEKSRDTLFEGGDIHSEIIPINPKVKGLIAKVEKIEDCPDEFLKFAKVHDLPIILMKPVHD